MIYILNIKIGCDKRIHHLHILSSSLDHKNKMHNPPLIKIPEIFPERVTNQVDK